MYKSTTVQVCLTMKWMQVVRSHLLVNQAELAGGRVGGRAEVWVEHQVVHLAAGLVVRDARDRVRVHVPS